jgi:hypothetical protein
MLHCFWKPQNRLLHPMPTPTAAQVQANSLFLISSAPQIFSDKASCISSGLRHLCCLWFPHAVSWRTMSFLAVGSPHTAVVVTAKEALPQQAAPAAMVVLW